MNEEFLIAEAEELSRMLDTAEGKRFLDMLLDAENHYQLLLGDPTKNDPIFIAKCAGAAFAISSIYQQIFGKIRYARDLRARREEFTSRNRGLDRRRPEPDFQPVASSFSKGEGL